MKPEFFLTKLVYYFYIFNILLVILLYRKDSKRIRRILLQSQNLREKINILNDKNSKETKNNAALKEKISRYDKLRKIVEEINKNLSLDSIANHLTLITFSQIGRDSGTCILYLVDNQTQKIMLFKTRKEDKKLVIKEKEGDVFDFWVLRHANPLLIESTKKDFRFDLERLKFGSDRPVTSLISAPLISEHKFLGILRMDNVKPGFYSQDDLRFLATICDLGAVALENGELFQKTQDLAIHDSLTSLFTKGYFLERLKEEYLRTIRKNRTFSLLMLDIDYFKHYNDKFGHSAGDLVLKDLSLNLVDSLKELNPIITRFGGEEFCILLSGIEKEKACTIAQELCARIANNQIILRNEPTRITVSIGVASLPCDTNEPIELIFTADRAMYKAKQKGRNQVACA